MGRTRTSKTAGALGALGALVAALLVVLATPQQAAALPAVCSSGASNVTVWTGNAGSLNWDTAGNWTNGVPNASDAIACIPSGKAVSRGQTLGDVTVNQLYIDGNSLVDLVQLKGLTFDGLTTPAVLGGPGRFDVHGQVDFLGNAQLKTGAEMAIRPGGRARIDSDSFISADWGTATTIDAGGTLEIQGSGGYYQGTPVAGQGIGRIISHGTIEKTSGGSASIIDADYASAPPAQIAVVCCATLAFAGGQVVSGEVQPNMALGTGACGAGTTSICNGSVNPAVDPSSVVLQLAGNNGNPAAVQVQELAQPPDATDSRAIGNEVYAHADGLTTDRTQSATITLRFSQADVMDTPLDQVQVGHISDGGVMTRTPDCNGPDLPSGANYCIVRPVTRNAQNTFVTIKTIETSRWRLRRVAPGESFAQSAPSVAQTFTAKPGDGSVVRLSWAAPANDGGAAVSSYAVYLDKKLVATTTAPSAAVANAGPGKHTIEVAAVNAIGTGARVSVTVTLKKLSQPRKAKALRGAAGGKKTAGLKWKAPASAGGLQIKAYQVVVVDKAGKVVAKKKVTASKHRLMLTFKTTGKYRFKVRAKNLAKYGPFSAWTDYVKPR